jgi:hypothetical protein
VLWIWLRQSCRSTFRLPQTADYKEANPAIF